MAWQIVLFGLTVPPTHIISICWFDVCMMVMRTVLWFAWKSSPTRLWVIFPLFLPIIEDKVMEEESSLYFGKFWSWAKPGATTKRCKPLACPLACALVYQSDESDIWMKPWTSSKKLKEKNWSKAMSVGFEWIISWLGPLTASTASGSTLGNWHLKIPEQL